MSKLLKIEATDELKKTRRKKLKGLGESHLGRSAWEELKKQIKKELENCIQKSKEYRQRDNQIDAGAVERVYQALHRV